MVKKRNSPATSCESVQLSCRLEHLSLEPPNAAWRAADCTIIYCFTVCISVPFSLFNSSQRKSQWKASLKRWVLSPARNWLQLVDGQRRWSGTELQTAGAAMIKLRFPNLVVLVSWNKQITTLGQAETRAAWWSLFKIFWVTDKSWLHIGLLLEILSADNRVITLKVW